jgi:L-asparagine transporter-like permease
LPGQLPAGQWQWRSWQAAVSNLWTHVFLPNENSGLRMAMAIIMFSFGGLEMLGFTSLGR